MVSLIHATRSRPHQSFETMKRWVQRAASDDFEIILSVDTDDLQIDQYYTLYRSLPHPFTWQEASNRSSVEAINRGARIAQGNILIVVSDDQDCPTNWLPKVQRYTRDKTDFVLKVKDGFQQRLITMPIIDRVYYNRDGYIYHPKFDHLFADTFFTDVAFKRKRVISKNITFKHNQYSIVGAVPDEINMKNNATYESGKRTYHELKRTAL